MKQLQKWYLLLDLADFRYSCNELLEFFKLMTDRYSRLIKHTSIEVIQAFANMPKQDIPELQRLSQLDREGMMHLANNFSHFLFKIPSGRILE